MSPIFSSLGSFSEQDKSQEFDQKLKSTEDAHARVVSDLQTRLAR
jgi:hypothetical protein